MTEQSALTEFAQTRSPQAFAGIVQSYVDLVYSTARRITRDSHLAEDVTQAVFIVLARRAKTIDPRYLAGWLVNTARLASRDALRAVNRRRKHETGAAAMRSEIQTGDETTADQITPLLDESLARLSEADRSAIVIRFLQGRSFSDVGQMLGITDEAARKRVDRAVEKLRGHLFRQGITATTGGLAINLAAHQAGTAPAVIASQTVATSLSGSAAGAAASMAKGVSVTMSMAKAQMVLMAILLVAALVGGGVVVTIAADHSTTAPASQPAPVVQKTPTTPPGDQIQVNDRLLIKVKDLRGLNMVTTLRSRVDSSGRISVPYLGQLAVEGKLPVEVQAAIAKAFLDDHILPKPEVHVDFDEHGDQISITSGPFQIGDHLLLHVQDLERMGIDTVQLQVVTANGTIKPPLLKEMKVEGLTEFEVQTAVAKGYRVARVLAEPQVEIERISRKEADEPKTLREFLDPAGIVLDPVFIEKQRRAIERLHAK
jgi:RNA polymerase sigma factor (sigma-70 family)